jgi:ribonuclease P protein component
MKAFGYNKSEKLKSRKELDAIFGQGKSIGVFPIKLFYQLHQGAATANIKAGVGVSARHFKKAVQRNRIKRLLRECYRKEKQILYSLLEGKAYHLTVFFLYVDKEMPAYEVLQAKMPLAMSKLLKQLQHEMGISTT